MERSTPQRPWTRVSSRHGKGAGQGVAPDAGVRLSTHPAAGNCGRKRVGIDWPMAGSVVRLRLMDVPAADGA